jgi:hypothetical protein
MLQYEHVKISTKKKSCFDAWRIRVEKTIYRLMQPRGAGVIPLFEKMDERQKKMLFSFNFSPRSCICSMPTLLHNTDHDMCPVFITSYYVYLTWNQSARYLRQQRDQSRPSRLELKPQQHLSPMQNVFFVGKPCLSHKSLHLGTVQSVNGGQKSAYTNNELAKLQENTMEFIYYSPL